MKKAIGMVEFWSVPIGMEGTDHMLKAADVDILQAKMVCPGKYIVLICGKLSSIHMSIESVKKKYEEENQIIDTFVLGNPHPHVLDALGKKKVGTPIEALGILETRTVSSMIAAADEAVKAAIVNLLEIHIAANMCGKSYMTLTGEIAAVEAAIEKGRRYAQSTDTYLCSSVIPAPDEKLTERFYKQNDDRR